MLFRRFPEGELIAKALCNGKRDDNGNLTLIIRFLKPSQVKGVDTDAFLRNQHLSMHIHENSVLGYRGLLGKSYCDFVPLNLELKILTKPLKDCDKLEILRRFHPHVASSRSATSLAHKRVHKKYSTP